MKQKYLALAIGILPSFVMNSADAASGEYGNHYVSYYNSQAEALAKCIQSDAPKGIPETCNATNPQKTTFVCDQVDVPFQIGTRNYITDVMAYGWTGTTCAPAGANFYHFVYRITDCAAGDVFVGPSATNCVPQAEYDIAESVKKQLGNPRGSGSQSNSNGPENIGLIGYQEDTGSFCAKPFSSAAGNPCDSATGNKFESATDFSGGNGIPSFVRFYNSLSFSTVGLGIGWSHNYAKRVINNPPGSKITIIREDGRSEVFNKTASGWLGDADTSYIVETVKDENITIKRKDGGVEVYGFSSGLLINESDPFGRTTTLTYTGQNLTKITGPYGHSITVTWGGTPSKIIRITLPDAKQVNYTQSTTLNLTQVNFPNSTLKKYHYENSSFPNALTGVTDQMNNRLATFAYDSNGMATLTEHIGGTQKFEFTYNSNNTTTVSLTQQPFFTSSFSTNLGVRRLVSKTWMDGSTLSQQWNPNNTLLSKADELNRTTSFTWDSLNRLASITDPASRTTSYTYLGSLALPLTISSPSVAPGQNKVTAIQYDSANLPVQITESGFKPNGDPVARTSSMSWTAAGQIESVTDPLGNVTLFEYWIGSTGGKSGQLSKITNAKNQAILFMNYDNAGRLLTEVSASGVTTTYTYDNVGNVKTIAESAIGATTRTTSFTYNNASLLLTQTMPNGLVLTYGYDTAHRLTSIKDNLNNKVVYGYDDKNNQTLLEVRDSSNALVRQIQNTFDARNRLKTINSGGSLAEIFYDYASQITSATDPNSNSSSYQYDLVGRLTQHVNALNGTAFTGYNLNGEITSVTAPNNANTTYAVDDLGNKLSEASPDRGATNYGYDANGNLTSKTDARGITASIAYDVLNRITNIFYPTPGEDVSYSYDTCQSGRLCGVVDSSGAWNYSYDPFGRVSSTGWTVQGNTYTTSYTWTPVDQLASVTYPSGRTVVYARNAVGQISAVTSNGANVSSGRTYRADGLLAGQTYGNGLNETRAYDLQGRLSAWALAGTDNRSYTYDPNSNILGITGLPSATYSYDALNRLSTEVGQGFSYDANGNRLSDANGSYVYTPNSNRMTSSPQGDVAIDAAGLTTADQSGSRVFSYNQGGRLVSVTAGGNTVGSYSYDYQGRRSSKVTGSGSTLFHFDLDGNLIAETDSNGVVAKEYVWAGPVPLAQIESGTTTYLAADQINTPRIGTNSFGALVWRWDGGAFGESSPVVQAVTVNLRFPGQYFDTETGLHQNWNRDYLPASGRYMESDQIGLVGGGNTYGYVNGNPMIYADQRGLDRQATGPAVVITDMTGGRTIFYDPQNRLSYTEIQSNNAVTRAAHARDADTPYHGKVTVCQRGKLGAPYGTAKLRTTDSRSRWVHGGGSGLPNPYAPKQGWKPTEGCTRAQNEDIEELCDVVEDYQQSHPSVQIPYGRF